MTEGPITRRCTMCAISWHDNDEFDKCAQCGEPTERIWAKGGPPLTLAESRDLRNEIRVAERNRLAQERLDNHVAAVQLERRITVGAAAIRHDADKEWTTFDGDLGAWADGRE